MKPNTLTPIVMLIALWVNSAYAGDAASAADLAKASGCLSCHAIAEKIVGPSYQDVAAKYANDNDAQASLVQSIRNGSIGKWGTRIAMPAHPSLSTEDLTTLANWVLTQKH